jgi:transcription elongation GreA/GreB family factor
MTPDRTAAASLRAVGLLADGPIPWGRPLPPVGPGVFVVELADPRASAPIELTLVGKWLERVETLRLDGERPTSRALAARLANFWLPSQPVLFVGSSATSVSRRVAAIEATTPGHRRPSSAGHWLHALTMPAGARVWWATTTATEEYEDELLAAFASGVSDAERGTLPDTETVLPFASLARPTGERKRTGLTGSLLPEPVEPPPPPTRIVQLPDGDAEGARGAPPEPKRHRAASPPRPKTIPSPSATLPESPMPAPDATDLTPDGAARLQAELDELIRVRRPEVIRRIATAREHGDLKENAEYHAAREEQGFLEARIKSIEAKLKVAVVVAPTVRGATVELGSKVRVAGKGHGGINGGAPGDLFLMVNVATHPFLIREGDNIRVVVPVTLTEAALGARIEVPTVDGRSGLPLLPRQEQSW